MKDIYCQFCNTLLINKQCNSCHCYIFFLNKLVLKPQKKKEKFSYNFITSEYEPIENNDKDHYHEPLFDLINSKYDIPEYILLNFIKLRYLQYISDIKILDDTFRIIYFVKKDFSFIENFKNSNFYLYSSYTLKDLSYKPQYFDQKYRLVKEENNLTYFLNINHYSISLFIEIKEKSLIPYDDSILNIYEMTDLYTAIQNNPLYNHFELSQNKLSYYAEYIIKTKEDNCFISLDDFHNNILESIKRHNHTIKKIQNGYLKFFERVLLEKELKNF